MGELDGRAQRIHKQQRANGPNSTFPEWRGMSGDDFLNIGAHGREASAHLSWITSKIASHGDFGQDSQSASE